jgi:hypothetical protein
MIGDVNLNCLPVVLPECAYISISVSGSGVTADNASWKGPDSISADFHIAADATGGDRTVTVSFNFVETTSVTFYVQVPTSLSVVSVSTMPLNGGYNCTTGVDYGIEVATQYQVMDQASPAQPISSSNWERHLYFHANATYAADTASCGR